jgi:hypothetical protein
MREADWCVALEMFGEECREVEEVRVCWVVDGGHVPSEMCQP